ncbi:NUDIX hydrolase [Pseudonocardia asaccharolytica]|uniref:Coenzyme A pyrophosphatase n=1 Tax=Pseudonocardia asaccharolytica DSM 44247 = NBRC 16224 TaxID=1123024 RepID=A0A511D0W4_9PSEU|nr:CoA pyrophosphatase [Pseudonocardia asaccharolytica]GEL18416.1 coenzyme A pyrophosphatase [Pseudonocardia asaccharolytica DSM 44247 = NBRC 16224]
MIPERLLRLHPERAPQWLVPLLEGVRDVDAATLSRHRIPPPAGGRRAAVLMLFAEGNGTPDVLLMERAADLRNHPGQVAFPGGSIDQTDPGPVAAALREAEEETGLDPTGVVPLTRLPELFIPPSGFVVTPVLAHWERPTQVRAVDPAETARVVRVPIEELADPANRLTVHHPSGFVGPAFNVAGLLVWGFTGGILSALLQLGGWERPWDPSRAHNLGEAWSAARAAGQEVAGR